MVLPHDDVIKWKPFPRYWPFVWGIHRSPVNSPHKCLWRGALMFSLICAWINGWVNKREAGDWRPHQAHYDVTVMEWCVSPGGHHRGFYPNTLSSDQLSATHLKFGHLSVTPGTPLPQVRSGKGTWGWDIMGARPSNELQWLDFKVSHQNISPSAAKVTCLIQLLLLKKCSQSDLGGFSALHIEWYKNCVVHKNVHLISYNSVSTRSFFPKYSH